jgi:glycosyltransferase involved in cell wall biosynthesis
MPKLLQINVTANWGSTGKIAEDIGRLAMESGWESWIAYGRGIPQSKSQLVRIGNDLDMKFHAIQTRLFDNHGLASVHPTKKFIRQIQEIKPDIIHLHNIHGYFLNYPILFSFLKEYRVPIVWTLHDCWPFTGHCAYYDYAKCDKWLNGCYSCPQLRCYPASLFADRSRENYNQKKKSFFGCESLTLVPVSDWLNGEVARSFLSEYNILTIHNGIDLSVFKPSKPKERYILGCASVWDKRKGLQEFIKLRNILPNDIQIILVGLSQKQIGLLPQGIKGITRTDNVKQLVDLYSSAIAFVNPTLEDNFPTTNLEALACGTPVITYCTGGSPEAIDRITGIVVPQGDIQSLSDAIVKSDNSGFSSTACRERVEKYFDKNICFKKYLDLYDKLMKI